jgi:hypothetical protein
MIRAARFIVFWGLVWALVSAGPAGFLEAQEAGTGNLVGFVFAKDGATPVEGARILVRNVTTGEVYESPKSDHLGLFKFEKIASGLYAIGVASGEGDFNSQDFVGISPDGTSKVTINLDPYDEKAIADAQAMAREQKEAGEYYVGKVVRYLPQSKDAEVFIERGIVHHGERLHFMGSSDFFVDARKIRIDGEPATRLLTTQSGLMRVTGPCAPGDLVFVVCKRGVPPFFLVPLGIASVVAGSATLVTIEEEDTSPFRVKK